AVSRRKRLTGSPLKVAARHEAARLLAKGPAAVPTEHRHHSPAAGSDAAAVSAFGPPASALAYSQESVGRASASSHDARDPREQTPAGRLEMALETLEPYQRLACVSYFLDGVSTDAIATLLGVPIERAVRILEGSAPTIARAVGEHAIPDFSAATDEIEVVTL
ncbi:MAG: sigma-70 family RNA polymerase sigma factor, partial [Demequinaceae bacterium]|nr:sigma-70 family RNA polymerase sigma factor [Demequinaceae bacterium]